MKKEIEREHMFILSAGHLTFECRNPKDCFGPQMPPSAVDREEPPPQLDYASRIVAEEIIYDLLGMSFSLMHCSISSTYYILLFDFSCECVLIGCREGGYRKAGEAEEEGKEEKGEEGKEETERKEGQTKAPSQGKALICFTVAFDVIRMYWSLLLTRNRNEGGKILLPLMMKILPPPPLVVPLLLLLRAVALRTILLSLAVLPPPAPTTEDKMEIHSAGYVYRLS
jgi:hypothetical protein